MISEVREWEAWERGKVGLRVVALALHDFYEEAEVCAVQVGCAAAGIRRGWVEDLASYGGQGEER